MSRINRIVPVSLCLTAALVLGGCDQTSADQSAQVAAVKQTAPAQVKAPSQAVEAPAAPPVAANPPAETASVKADAIVAKSQPTDASLSDSAEVVADVAAPPAEGQPPVPDPITPPLNRPQAPPQPVDPAAWIVKADDDVIDFGDIPTNDAGKATLKLTNTGDKPATVVAIQPTCGCTAVDFKPNTVLEPQQSIDVQIKLNGGMKAGPIAGKRVTVKVEGQPDMPVMLKANAVAFIVMEPDPLDPEKMPEGKFTLRSIDGAPFKVLSMQPAVITDFGAEAKAVHELIMPYDKYREVGVQRKTMIFTDHPKCGQIYANINWSPAELSEAARRMAEAAGRQMPPAAPGTPENPIVKRPVAVDADTATFNLMKEGKNDEVVKKIEGGLDVNHRDNTGLTLLGMAAKAGNPALVKELLARKAELEGADNVGRTPLMWAAQSKNIQALQALLDAGASVTHRDSIGGTAMTWAAGFGDAAAVRELLDAGADVEVVSMVTGWTPLTWAAGFGDPASIEPLVAAKANVEIADNLQGATPLIHASRTGKVDGIRALLKAGAKIESADKNGNTPLLTAASASGGDVEKVKALLEAGANLHAKDNRGLNALQLAEKRTDIRAPDVIKLLQPLLGGETPASEMPAAGAAPAGDKPAGGT